MRRVLITAFDPFGGDSVNAAEELIGALPPVYKDLVLEKRIVPTQFKACQEKISDWLPEGWDMVLCVGQAAGRTFVTPERTAVNLMDAGKPDNAGFRPDEEPILPGGPAAYFSNLPVKEASRRLWDRGYPVRLSDTAGTYVCNCIFYRLMHEISVRGLSVKGGFIHVPLLTGQRPDAPGMAPETALTTLLELIGTYAEICE